MEQLITYHANSLSQAQTSFKFSIAAATFGFLVIVGGAIWGAYQGLGAAAPSLISGAIIDSVAALFFAQSNQARKLMTDFFDKLRKDRQFQEALRLCESISDSHLQSVLKVRLSLFFAGIRDDMSSIDEVSSSLDDAISNAHKNQENKIES